MGSSVCAGQGATQLKGYAFQYNQALYQRSQQGSQSFFSSNISIGGTNTLVTKNRFQEDLVPECGKYLVFGLSLGNEGIHGSSNPQAIFDQWRDNMLDLIALARMEGYEPIIANCYTRNDFNASDYNYTKAMNLLIHEWDVPSVNLLGSVDDGTGKWVNGYWDDGSHPNDAGHYMMFTSIVPSLFDALGSGKPQPELVSGSEINLNHSGGNTALVYTPETDLESFTTSIQIKTSDIGSIVNFVTDAGKLSLSITSEGKLNYSNHTGVSIVNDNVWHTISFTHYAARKETLVYLDGSIQISLEEELPLEKMRIGDVEALVSAKFRNWFFYRAGMTTEEIQAIHSGELLKSSLELYAPLDGSLVSITDSLANLAQSTNEIALEEATGLEINNLDISPSGVIEGQSVSVKITFNVLDNSAVSSVRANLVSVGGPSSLIVNETDGIYQLIYLLPSDLEAGEKVILITATDDENKTLTKEISFNVTPDYELYPIYTDYGTEVCATCKWTSNGVLSEVNSNEAIEGNNDLVFDYTNVSWYSGFGLNITGWSREATMDFSTFDNLLFSYKGVVGEGAGFNIKLVNPDRSAASGELTSNAIAFANSTDYKTVTIPLTDFTSIDLSDISGLQFAITGTQTGSGVLRLDNIVLEGKKVTASLYSSEFKDRRSFIYPNPITSGLMNIDPGFDSIWEIVVIDDNGRVVKSESGIGRKSIPHNLPKGHYSILLKGNRTTAISSLVIR